MKKDLLKILAVFSVVLLTSFIITANANAKKDHPNKSDQFGLEEIQETEVVEVTQTMVSDNPVKVLSHSGKIIGIVQFCDQRSNAGALVYIPGKSFLAKTGERGEFTLSYVPEGIWSLIVEVQGQDPFEIPDVEVRKKMITDLGEISLCTDSDGDGFYLPEDCDDNNPEINPYAKEVSDNIDNNCDGNIDEGCCTDNDLDGFYAEEDCWGLPPDCNDNDPKINPYAEELCDGEDNNCNNLIDERCH